MNSLTNDNVTKTYSSENNTSASDTLVCKHFAQSLRVLQESFLSDSTHDEKADKDSKDGKDNSDSAKNTKDSKDTSDAQKDNKDGKDQSDKASQDKSINDINPPGGHHSNDTTMLSYIGTPDYLIQQLGLTNPRLRDAIVGNRVRHFIPEHLRSDLTMNALRTESDLGTADIECLWAKVSKLIDDTKQAMVLIARDNKDND